jgi:hypothetical protein
MSKLSANLTIKKDAMIHPTYLCKRVDRELNLTGKADDSLWATAETVTLNDPLTGAPGKFRTAAKLLYNDRCLYIAFQCEDDYVWGTHLERDDPIWKQECVEVFICPSGKIRQYYEINVSPRNTVYDSAVLNGTPEDGRHNLISLPQYDTPGMVTKVHIDGELGVKGAKGWSAEYAIPFTALIGADHLVPESGDEWRLNLYRLDSYEENKLDYYSWAEVGKRDFHRPWMFGTLKFA